MGRCLSTSSRVIVSMSLRKPGSAIGCESVKVCIFSLPTLATKATISIPYMRERHFSAIAPAATRQGP